MAFPLFF